MTDFTGGDAMTGKNWPATRPRPRLGCSPVVALVAAVLLIARNRGWV